MHQVCIIYVCTYYICMYLYMYVFVYVCIYLCIYLYMYVFIHVCNVCRHITTAYMYAGSSNVAEHRPTRVINPRRGQLCTQTSVHLHLYTSGTNDHIPWTHTHRPTSAQAYVHTREITKIQQYTGKLKPPCTLCASLRLFMPNTVRV